jgi:glycosyltransferase involved in cell wall biosynthesis
MTPAPICHLRFSDVVGGVETHLLTLLPELDPARCAARVICFPNPPFEERLRAAGIPVETLARRGPRDLGFILRLRLALRRSGCRLVHTHGVFEDLYAGLAGRLTLRRPRHIVTKHTFADADQTMPARKIRAFDRLDRWVTYPRVDRIIAVSEERRRGLIERQRVKPEKIVVLHNGVKVDPDMRPESIAPELRRSLGLAPDVPLIGFVGRLNPEKAPDVFVEAFAHVARAHPDARAVIVGDGPMKAGLETRAASLGLAERLHWVPFRDEIAPLLVDMDVIVMPSRTEGFPMLLLEAMALARPVVASEVGGIPEVIERGRSGWLCPRADAAAFGEVVSRVLEHPEARRLVGEQARRTVLERFTAEIMAQRMMALYDEVLAGH